MIIKLSHMQNDLSKNINLSGSYLQQLFLTNNSQEHCKLTIDFHGLISYHITLGIKSC